MLLVAAAVLAACSPAHSAPDSSVLGDWQCTAIDPTADTLPDNPCFRANLQQTNQITLEWRVTNSRGLVYLIDDMGVTYDDPGYQKADCTAPPHSACNIRFHVTGGGFHRWLLQVENPNGAVIYASAELEVPAPYPPRVSTGGKLDPLSIVAQTISWQADKRNNDLSGQSRPAWITLQDPVTHIWQLGKNYPRSGPEADYEVPASALSDLKSLSVKLRDCQWPANSKVQFCSQAAASQYVIGGDQFLHHNPLYAGSNQNLTLKFTTRSGARRELSSKTLIKSNSGKEMLAQDRTEYRIDMALLTPGEHSISIASCKEDKTQCTESRTLRILVDYAVDWLLDRHYEKDFYPGTTYSVLGPGEPLDITYSNAGDIWMINEFSNNVERISSDGTVSTQNVPLARIAKLHGLNRQVVAPFAMNLFGNSLVPASFSSLGERAIEIDSTLWFTQGGSLTNSDGADTINVSRVIALNPAVEDSPKTARNDRLCIYNIPAPTSDPAGNNQVIGLTHAADRIWISEARGFLNDTPSAISSFIPDPASCEGMLNFSDPKARRNAVLQYCREGETPEKNRCIASLPLVHEGQNIKAAHLTIDPIDNSIWFTDYRGRYLGNLTTDGNQVLQFYPYPQSWLPKTGEGSFFAGAAWSVHADAEAVYFSEYRARRILRFDKKSKDFNIVDVPVAAAQDVLLHSTAIDHINEKLWFTLTNEPAVPWNIAGSTIGYIDLKSWQSRAANPESGISVKGVIYMGLSEIPGDPRSAPMHQAFRGIAVNSKTGNIALATMHRRQVTELKPLPLGEKKN